MHRIRGRLTKQYHGDMTTVRDELRKRINKDVEIFKAVKCDYAVDANGELEEVLEDVIRIIENV